MSPNPPVSSGNLVRRVVLVMLAAVGLYGSMILYRGVANIQSHFANYAWWTFGAACGLSFANYLLRFLKWEYYLAVLEIRGIPKGESLLTFLSGFVLTVTPGKVGEVFKSLVLRQTHGVPVERSAPIVVAERITDLIAIVTMIAIGSLGFEGGILWASAGGIVVMTLLVFIGSPRLQRPVLSCLPRLPGSLGRLGARIGPRIEEALSSLRELTTPRRLFWPSLLSIVGWSLEGVALWLILLGFGQDLPLTLAIFFYSTATLAGALIPLPGGLGITDGLIEEQLVHLGHVGTGIATGAMLLVRFATLWFAVLVGFLALAGLRHYHPDFKIGGNDVRGDGD
jgi:uncharacterized protein (TIRG00374 family)